MRIVIVVRGQEKGTLDTPRLSFCPGRHFLLPMLQTPLLAASITAEEECPLLQILQLRSTLVRNHTVN